MARNEQDPAASTQQFRAFAKDGESGTKQGPNIGMIVALVLGIVVVVAVIALFAV